MLIFEEPEVMWVALCVDPGNESTEGFRKAILAGLEPALDDGEHITEMYNKVQRMNEAEAVRLMADVGRLRATDAWFRGANGATS